MGFLPHVRSSGDVAYFRVEQVSSVGFPSGEALRKRRRSFENPFVTSLHKRRGTLLKLSMNFGLWSKTVVTCFRHPRSTP